MREDLPTGAVTFLFTDVEGSTTLLRQLGAEAYAGALAEHRRTVREACAAEGGVEVDTQGDAFFFAFPTAPGAVAAAEAMSEVLAPGPIHLRIGLHTGTALVTDEGYVGDDVHLAARVAASGHGGQVVLSQATRALLDGRSLSDLGEHRLKDVEGAVAIFQLGQARFPPLKTISNTNLPRPASSFVGRSAELAEVISLVEDGSRLVTLTGPGGSGKTRLALEAAATLVPSYNAGVFWIGLASLRDASLVTATISQTIGSKTVSSSTSPSARCCCCSTTSSRWSRRLPSWLRSCRLVPTSPCSSRAGSSCACRAKSSTRYLRSHPEKPSRSSARARGSSPPRRSQSSAPASTISR